MKVKKLLQLFSGVLLTGISLAGCNGTGNKEGNEGKVMAADAPVVIKNDELYPFMLAGVYFFHGYGGPERVYNSLIKPAVDGEPGDESFSKTLQAAYSRYFIFPFKPEDDKNGKEAKATLSDYWNVNSRADLEKTLDWLLIEGHQQQYAQFRKALDENGGKDADIAKIDLAKYNLSKDNVQALQFIKAHYTEFSKAGIKAWDLARYINNICVAYQAGYFTRGEAIAWLQKAPQVAQQYYSDWNAYFNDFLLGRESWGGGETDHAQFKSEVKGMLEGKYSIYNYLLFK
jgi:hypothetical protein